MRAEIDLDEAIEGDFEASEFVWEMFASIAKFRSTAGTQHRLLPITPLLFQGNFSESDADELLALLDGCPFEPLECTARQAGFLPSVMPAKDAAMLAHQFQSVRPTPDLLAFLGRLLASIDDVVTTNFGCNWRVVTIKASYTLPGAVRGMAAWHTDGFPLGMRKILIYPKAPSAENGSVAFKTADDQIHVVQGPKGSWILFDNSLVPHRGLAPLNDRRPMIECLIAPTLDVEGRFDPEEMLTCSVVGSARQPFVPPLRFVGSKAIHQSLADTYCFLARGGPTVGTEVD